MLLTGGPEIEDATVRSLARTIEARDAHTGSHVERVHRYSVDLARALDLPESDVHRIGTGAMLHDLGKIGIPDVVLNKRSSLTEVEQAEMRRHPLIGADLLAGNPILEPARDAVLFHHERWDGSGYPYGRRRHEIPLDGRIVAVADAFDAMTADRPYRGQLSVSRAMDELLRGSGSQFDPTLVRAFLSTPSFRDLARTAALSLAPRFFRLHQIAA